MNEYRVTRDYPCGQAWPAHTDITMRQGHCCRATNIEELKLKLKQYFPEEKSFTYQEIVQGQIELQVHKLSLGQGVKS